MDETEKKIYVEQGSYEKDGKEYYSYYIKGQVRGKEVRVAIVPPDNGGYRVLEIVYGEAKEAELVLTPYEMRDEKTGRVITGNTYAVRTTDENGEVYECKVKPFRDSDKTLLNMLLK
jgi:hypothetical protein